MTEYARDDYNRTVAGSWGTADVGGAWSQDLATGVTASVGTPSGRHTFPTTLGRADQRLAAATASLNAAAAVRHFVNANWGIVDQSVTIYLRSSGTIATPTGYYARTTYKPDKSIVLDLGYSNAGAETVLRTTTLPVNSFVAGSPMQFEFQAIGANPTQLWARVYKSASIPAGNVGWLGASDDTGPQVAGIYQLRLTRAASATASTVMDMDFVYATDIPQPIISYSVSGTTATFDASGSTGDFTSYSWDFGDGSAAGSGVAPSHTFPGTGTFRVTATGTTRWGATFTGSTWVTTSSAILPTDVLPVVLINGVDVCDQVASVDWSLGRDHWADSFAGLTCSVRLRGIVSCSQGQALTVSVPSVAGGQPLWSGIIDTVTESYEPFDARNETTVLAMDTASQLARYHLESDAILAANPLPARLSQIRTLTGFAWLTFRYRYSVPVLGGRWLQLKKRPIMDTSTPPKPAEKMRELTYLGVVGDALLGSLAFGYTARDGAISYAPWEAPPSLPSTPRIDLNSGPDCAARITLDRNAVEGIINRWTVGDGYRRTLRGSIESYGERAYTVPSDTLANDADFPFGPTMFDPQLINALAQPVRAATAEVPVTSWSQSVITANPLDLATWNSKVYSILGIRHTVDFAAGWRVSLSLDRNPWEMNGSAVP